MMINYPIYQKEKEIQALIAHRRRLRAGIYSHVSISAFHIMLL